MKKFLTVMMAMFLGLSSSAYAVEFADVTISTPYNDSIDWMARNNVIEGYKDGTFGPDLCVNRVEFLKMLFETLEVNTENSNAILFSDTPAGEWYIPYVKTARQRGTINGYPDGTFKPGQCVNRVEAVKMAVLAFNNGEVPESYGSSLFYTDVSTNEWYFPYLDYVFGANAVGLDHTGYDGYSIDGDYAFGPDQSMTRKEVAEMLYRMKVLQDYERTVYYEYSTMNPDPIDESSLFFNACVVDEESYSFEDVDVENVFDPESDFVMIADHTNEEQVENLKEILVKFSNGSLSDSIVEEYDSGVTKTMSFENTLGQIMMNSWEVGVALNLDDGLSIEDLDSLEGEDVELFIAGVFESSDQAEYLFGRMLDNEYGSEIQCSVKGDVEIWTAEYDDFYALRAGDLFILTTSQDHLDDALTRVQNGESFDSGEYSEDLGYMFVDVEALAGIVNDVYSEMGMNAIVEQISAIGEVEVSFSSEDEALRLSSNSEIINPDAEFLQPYMNAMPYFLDKVSAEGMMLYSEQPSLATALDSLAVSFAPVFLGVSGEMGESVMDEFYSGLYREIAPFDEEGKLENYEELRNFLDSPVAVSIADVGEFFPEGMMYLHLTDEPKRTYAKDLSMVLDNVFADLISSMNEAEEEAEMFKWVKSIDGNVELRKVYIDVNEVPEDVMMEIEMYLEEGQTIDDLLIEMYYGVIGDAFVFGFSNDFASSYDSGSSLADSSRFQSAKEHLNGVYGPEVAFVDMVEVVEYADGFVDFMTEIGEMSEYDVADYEMIREVISHFDFVIASGEVSMSEVVSELYVRFK